MPLRSAAAALVRPAGTSTPRAGDTALAGLRILVGLLWLYNVAWKLPPDFGKSSGSGVYGFSRDAVEHPVFPPYSWVVEQLVLPNFTAFGWMVLVIETLLAVLLLTGTLVRVAALVGVGQSLAIGLSVAQTPGEWPWAYWMMIGIHIVLLFTASGRVAAVDSVRAAATGGGQTAAVRLLGGWAVVVGLAGVLALALAADDGLLASEGEQLGGPDFSISVGSYNILGAGVLVVLSALMILAAALRQRGLALVAAVVAVLAALSVYVQLTRTDVWLGASNTSAAFLLCAAVVSGATAGLLTSTTGAPERKQHGTARAARTGSDRRQGVRRQG